MANKQPNNFQLFSFLKPEQGCVIYPFMQIIFGPYAMFINKFKEFFYIGGVYALLISLLYLFCGQSVFCNFRYSNLTSICSYNIITFICTRIIALYLISAFCIRYYQAVWQNKAISLSFIIKPQKTDIKSFLSLICFILVNSIAGLSWYILWVRVPNSDWRIELLFFGVVSVGFFAPLVCLRLYSLLAEVWGQSNLSNIWEIWKKTRGNNLRLIISLGFLFFVFSFSISAVIRNLSYYAEEANYLLAIGGEILYSIVILLIISFWINNCGIQKSILSKEITDESNKTN